MDESCSLSFCDGVHDDRFSGVADLFVANQQESVVKDSLDDLCLDAREIVLKVQALHDFLE